MSEQLAQHALVAGGATDAVIAGHDVALGGDQQLDGALEGRLGLADCYLCETPAQPTGVVLAACLQGHDVVPAAGANQIVRPTLVPGRPRRNPMVHLVVDAGAQLRISEALAQRIDAASEAPRREDGEQCRVDRVVGNDIGGHVDPFASRRVLHPQRCTCQVPITRPERLVMRVLQPYAGSRTDLEQLALGIDREFTRPSHMAGKEAVHFGDHSAEVDEFVGVRPHSGRVDQAGGEPVRPGIECRPQGVADTFQHRAAGGAGFGAGDRAAQASVWGECRDIERKRLRLQVFQVLGKARPHEVHPFWDDQRHESGQLVAALRRRRRNAETAVSDHLGGDSLQQKRLQ